MDFIVARQEEWIVERINDCINMNAAYKMLWVELKGELSMRCYTDYCVNVFFLHKTRFYQVSFQIKRWKNTAKLTYFEQTGFINVAKIEIGLLQTGSRFVMRISLLVIKFRWIRKWLEGIYTQLPHKTIVWDNWWFLQYVTRRSYRYISASDDPE